MACVGEQQAPRVTANKESFAKNAFKTGYGAGNCRRRNVQLFRSSERAFVPSCRGEIDEMTERDPRQPKLVLSRSHLRKSFAKREHHTAHLCPHPLAPD